MPIGDLLDWIDRRFACGKLVVERGVVTRSFDVDSGYVTAASSNNPAEHLGHLLISRGRVDEAGLQEAFRVQAQTGVRLGKILLMVGAVDEAGLREVLKYKIAESVRDVMVWNEGTFSFDPAPSTSVSEFEVSVNLRSCIDEGQHRREELDELRAVIPDDDVTLFVSDPNWRTTVSSDTDDGRLVAAIESGKTIGQVVLELGGQRYRVLKRLAEMLNAGVMAREQRRRPRTEGAAGMNLDELRQAAAGRAKRGDRAGALGMVKEALERDPESAALRKLLEATERSLFAELSRELLTSFRVPRLLKPADELERIELNEAERYLTGRIDGRWDLLSLMRVSPLRQVDALIAFRALADRGIISL